jgi:hypothetical protein
MGMVIGLIMKHLHQVLIFSFLAAPISVAQVGTLDFGNLAFDGGIVRVPVTLSGDTGDGVAAVDFRIRYDPDVFEPVGLEPGVAASAAGKQVLSNLVTPGEYVVLMFNVGQGTVRGGEIAEVQFRVLNMPEAGRSQLRITNTTLALPDATEFPSRGGATTVTFGGDPGEPGEEPEPDEPDPVTPEDPAPPAPPALPPLAGLPPDVMNDTPPDRTDSALPAQSPGAPRANGTDTLIARMREADGLRAGLPGAGTGGIGAGEASDQAAAPGVRGTAATPSLVGAPADETGATAALAGEASTVAGGAPIAAPGVLVPTPKGAISIYVAAGVLGAALVIGLILARRFLTR